MKTEFIDFKSFEIFIMSQSFQESLKNNIKTLKGNFEINNSILFAQFETNFGMRKNYILTDKFKIEENNTLLHTMSFSDKIFDINELYKFREFEKVSLIKI